MSVRNTLRAFPTLLRVGLSETVAYRAEMFVWILSTTMPLIMMALWTVVASEAPIGRFNQTNFVAYFLATFIVRQLTGAWAAWQMNFEVRTGTLAMRLLRPVHPLWHYAAENIAAMPLRLLVAIPVAAISLAVVGSGYLPRDPLMWVIWVFSILGGWLITFLANAIIGTLSFFIESSIKVMDVWLAAFFVFSGYLIPIDLFPPWLRTLSNWLPFRYQIGFPVELMTNGLIRTAALEMLARQWAFVFVIWAGCTWMWRRGVRNFAAYGG